MLNAAPIRTSYKIQVPGSINKNSTPTPNTTSTQQGPPTPVYDPRETMKHFRIKNNTITNTESNNRCLNLFLSNLDHEITNLAAHTTPKRGDNITKAERAVIKI